MTLTDRLLRLPPVRAVLDAIASRALTTLSSDDQGWGPARTVSPSSYAAIGRNARKLGFESHPTVHACTRVIAEACAAVPLQTYTRQQDGSPIVQPLKAPARLVLDRPRVGMTRYNLIVLTATHWVTYGNAFWVLERTSPRSAPYAIRLVHPEDLLVVMLDPETLEIRAFEWRDRQGRVHLSPAQDVVHFKDISAGDWLFGYPRAVTALLEMASEREANEYVRSILVNDGSPGNVAMTADGTSSEDAKKADARWRARMVERGGRGSTIFLAGVKDFKPIGFNLQNLEFPSLRAISRESICSAFGVDPRLVGASSAKGNEGGLSQAGYSEARRRLYSQTVIPMMRAIEATLDLEYSVEWGPVYVRFDPDAIGDLTETESERAERLTKLMTGGAITREEARRGLRYPERMPPGDTLVGSLGRIEYPVAAEGAKAAAALAPPAAPAALPPGKDGAKVSDGQGGADDTDEDIDGNGQDDTPEDDLTRGRRRQAEQLLAKMDHATRVLKRGVVLTEEARKVAYDRFDIRATKQEKPYERAARILFRQEREEIVGWLENGKVTKADAPDPIFAEATRRARANYKPGGKYHKAWAERYRSLIGETIVSSGGDLAATVGYSFNLANPRVEAAILGRAQFLSTKVCDYSSGIITDLLAEARRQGMGTRDAANLLRTTLEGLEPSRAIRIARTETVGALNEGEFVSAQQSDGALSTKEWAGIPDDRQRDLHKQTPEGVSGEVRKLSEAYSNGMMYPGDHSGGPEEVINCRCTQFFYD